MGAEDWFDSRPFCLQRLTNLFFNSLICSGLAKLVDASVLSLVFYVGSNPTLGSATSSITGNATVSNRERVLVQVQQPEQIKNSVYKKLKTVYNEQTLKLKQTLMIL